MPSDEIKNPCCNCDKESDYRLENLEDYDEETMCYECLMNSFSIEFRTPIVQEMEKICEQKIEQALAKQKEDVLKMIEKYEEDTNKLLMRNCTHGNNECHRIADYIRRVWLPNLKQKLQDQSKGDVGK